MDTSGLLLVSVFCNMQRTHQIGGKDTIIFEISHNLHGENCRNMNFYSKIIILTVCFLYKLHFQGFLQCKKMIFVKKCSKYSCYPNTCYHKVLIISTYSFVLVPHFIKIDLENMQLSYSAKIYHQLLISTIGERQ